MNDQEKKHRILIIEDSYKNIEVLGTILKNDYLISIANSGMQALKIIEKDIPDLILLDVMMPGMDGYETCKKIKENDKFKEIPVIFLSALSDSVEKVKGFDVGGVDFATKPINKEELLARIKTHLTIRNLQKKLQEMNEQLEEKVKSRTRIIEKERDFNKEIFDKNPAFIVAIDTNGKILMINNSMLKSVGYVLNEVEGRNFVEIFIKKNEQIKTEKILKKICKNKTVEIYEMELLTKNGDGLLIELHISKISNYENEFFLGIGIDITERKKVEEELNQIQKMEIVGSLAGGIAHDFNNVLGGIVGTISVIKKRMKNNSIIDNKKLKSYIDIMSEAGNRASEMVKQLLTLSHKQKIKNIPFNLNYSVENIMKICQNTFEKSIEVVADYYDKTAYVKGDPTQIEQVILNICINSEHSMTFMREKKEKWHGTLIISIKKSYIDKHFKIIHMEAKVGTYYQISIKDTGIGMSKDIISKIFNPFFTTKEKGKGTGLGLSMVYNIVMKHNGFIDVYSEEGKGTTFNIYLPVYEKKIVEQKEKHDENISVKEEGTILVIDDDKIMRLTITEILEDYGYEVLLAESGLDGIELFKLYKNKIKLVFLDMAMPGMSGKEVFIKLREIDPYTKILLTSGFSLDERIKQVKKMGVNGFIEKPFTSENLAGMIKKIIYEKDN